MRKHPLARSLFSGLAGLCRPAAVAALLIAVSAAAPAWAQPSEVGYQGRLVENGVPVTGSAQMKFAIISGGQTLWSNDGTSTGGSQPAGSVSVTVEAGVFSARLGAAPMVPLDAGLLGSASSATLRVWVRTTGAFEQLSDVPVSSSAFTLHSATADASPGLFHAPGGLVAATEKISLGASGTIPSIDALAGDNNLAIGFRTFTGFNPDPIAVGTFSNFRVGICTLTPTTTLDVNGNTYVRGGTFTLEGPTIGRLLEITSSGGQALRTTNDFFINTGGSVVFRPAFSGGTNRNFHIETQGDGQNFFCNGTNGFVGIGTFAPTCKLHVIGTVCAAGYVTTSDARLKTNIEEIDGAVGTLQSIRGVRFDWAHPDQAGFSDAHQIGLLAQEVEAVLPELVTTGGDGLKAVDYAKLVPVLVEAIKEQQQTIDSTGRELSELRAAIARLEASQAAR